jgi:hypothetical protein
MRSRRATATTHSSAALDDKPAPMGTFDEMRRSTPPASPVARAMPSTTPCTYDHQPSEGTSSVILASEASPISTEEHHTTPSSRRLAAATVSSWTANGNTNPAL